MDTLVATPALRRASANWPNAASHVVKSVMACSMVRVMLVPATMALLGDKNWYAPKWLQKILPHVNFSH